MGIHNQAGPSAILLTGATGYLGSLVAEVLLAQDERRVLALVRENHDRDALLEPILLEAQAKGQPLSAQTLDRLELVPFRSIEQLDGLAATLQGAGVDEIIHCAGCVDYFNSDQLELVNIRFTEELLDLAKRLDVQRFTYLSTAYSSGYVDGPILETAHGEPKADPTEYTRSKRRAENLVIDSGVPYLILRPSIVIGESSAGRYGGKRYGLYQQWMGLERLLCDRYHDEFHVVAPRQPLNVIHQDSFQTGFYQAFTTMDVNSILHLTSCIETSPTMRDLWDLWLNQVNRPKRIFYYTDLDDVPLGDIHPRQRAYLMFASVNLKIATHPWSFDSPNLDQLRHEGLIFPDATLSSVEVCQRRFIETSDRVQRFISENQSRMPQSCEVIDCDRATLDVASSTSWAQGQQ